jgi:hypothetical protein
MLTNWKSKSSNSVWVTTRLCPQSQLNFNILCVFFAKCCQCIIWLISLKYISITFCWLQRYSRNGSPVRNVANLFGRRRGLDCSRRSNWRSDEGHAQKRSLVLHVHMVNLLDNIRLEGWSITAFSASNNAVSQLELLFFYSGKRFNSISTWFAKNQIFRVKLNFNSK